MPRPRPNDQKPTRSRCEHSQCTQARIWQEVRTSVLQAHQAGQSRYDLARRHLEEGHGDVAQRDVAEHHGRREGGGQRREAGPTAGRSVAGLPRASRRRGGARGRAAPAPRRPCGTASGRPAARSRSSAGACETDMGLGFNLAPAHGLQDPDPREGECWCVHHARTPSADPLRTVWQSVLST